MREELASLNYCAVPFFKPRRNQLVLVQVYYYYYVGVTFRVYYYTSA